MKEFDTYEEKEFRDRYPKAYQKCMSLLKDFQVYFGEAWTDGYGFLNVYYNFEHDENRTAIFEFFEAVETIASYNLADID